MWKFFNIFLVFLIYYKFNMDKQIFIFIPQMKYNLAVSMKVNESLVSVKATTTDYLGVIGAGKGWAVQAVATLCKDDDHCCS